MKYLFNLYTLVILLLLNLTGYLLLYSQLSYDIVLYVIVIIVNSILYLFISAIIIKIEISRNYLFLLAASGIFFRLLLLPIPPTASDDINRYIWDGKVQANGINPYKYAPSAPELDQLSNDQLPSQVNFPEMKTIYPPYAQFIFFLSYSIFGESFFGIKVFLLISELLSFVILFNLLKTLNKKPKYLILYVLCPLPILMFMVDGHVDGVGFPFLLLFLLFYIKNKKLSSYVLYGLSMSAKIITIIVLPFLIKGEKGRNILLAMSIPVVVFLASYSPYFSTSVFPFESLITFTSHWMFNGSIFNVFYFITDNNQTARLISYSLFAVPAAFLFFSKIDLVTKVYFIFFLFFLFSPTVHPWYLTWIAVLLPLCFKWSGLLFVSLVSLANYVVINYQLRGYWQESALLLFIEYLPIYLIFFYEIYRSIKPLPAQASI